MIKIFRLSISNHNNRRCAVVAARPRTAKLAKSTHTARDISSLISLVCMSRSQPRAAALALRVRSDQTKNLASSQSGNSESNLKKFSVLKI